MMKSVLVWVGIVLLLLLVVQNVPSGARTQEIPFSTFYVEGQTGKYRSVSLSGFEVEGTYKTSFKNNKGETIERFKRLRPHAGFGCQDYGLEARWSTRRI